jgi:putative two-component system response regulator
MDNMEDTKLHPTVLVRPTVMIVDDAEDILMIMESILAREYSLKLYSRAQDALDYAFANPPDLIMLDVMMPGIDGFETCRRLKANPELRDIPVIFLTSKNEDEYEEMGFSAGASDFIHKPINAPIVNARVKTHLKIKFMMDYMRKENTRLKENAKHSSAELAEMTRVLWSSLSAKT